MSESYCTQLESKIKHDRCHGHNGCSSCMTDEIVSLRSQLTSALAERDEARERVKELEAQAMASGYPYQTLKARIAELEKSACPHGACDSLKGEIGRLRFERDEWIKTATMNAEASDKAIAKYEEACTRCIATQRGPAKIAKEIIDEVDGTTSAYLELEDGSGIGINESDIYVQGYETGYAQRGMDAYNTLAAQLATAWQQGAEAFREVAAKIAGTVDHWADPDCSAPDYQLIRDAIRALPVPERKEG